MQYLLTQDELDALKSKDKTPREQALKEIMAIFTAEFNNIPVQHHNWQEASFNYSDVKKWFDRVDARVKKLFEEQCKT